MFCTKCGAEMSSGAVFCANCGIRAVNTQNDFSVADIENVEIASGVGIPDASEDNRRSIPESAPSANAGVDSRPMKKSVIAKFIAVAAVVLVLAVIVVAPRVNGGNLGQVTNVAAQQNREPANLEELVASVDPDYPDRLRNTLLSNTSFVDPIDFVVKVSNNQVNITYIVSVKSTDTGVLDSLLMTYGNNAAIRARL